MSPDYDFEYAEIEPEYEERLWAVMDDALAKLVSWRLARQGAGAESPDVRSSMADVYATLERLVPDDQPAPDDLMTAMVLLLTETGKYGQMVDAGLRDLHQLAKTAGVPKGWRL